MEQHGKKYKSLSVQLTLFVLADFLLCVLAGVVVNFIGEKVIDQYYFSNQYSVQQQKRLEDDFRRYVQRKNMLSSDWQTLSKWSKTEGHILVSIYKDGYLIFDSEYEDESAFLEEEQVVPTQSTLDKCFRVEFADGVADVLISDYSYLAWYDYLMFGSIAFLSLIFLAAIFVYTYHKFSYIGLLSQEVLAMEQGETVREITIKGQDEITMLAESMERMRYSLAGKFMDLEQSQKEREKLVAEMSHDMRTPLTALMMYLDFLKEQEDLDEETKQIYVNKIHDKATSLKVMMDDMFSYFRLDMGHGCDLEQVSAPELLYEFISEITIMLEQEGFTVQEQITVPERSILFSSAYMSRIAGNIVSNIRKYADSREPVQMALHQEAAMVHTAGTRVQVLTLTIRNKKNRPVCPEETAMESMGLGMHNIQKMMEQMAGDMFCMEEKTEDGDESSAPKVYYELRLMFRITQ